MTAHSERAEDYLRHILEAIQRATTYAQQSGTFQAFETDVLLQDGIIRNIGVIGEAAIKIRRVAPHLVTEWPSIPWHDMQTMRHKLVHDYFDVDLSVVWTTVQHDLPQLATQIKKLLETLSTGGKAPSG